MAGGRVNWVCFAYLAFGCWLLAVGGAKIGFVSYFLVLHKSGVAEIGFVSCFWGVGVSPTSVRVKYRGGRPAACDVFLGSFRIFWSWGIPG